MTANKMGFRKNDPIILASVFLLIIACVLAQEDGRKNMVLIYIDDMRPDLSVAYNRPGSKTPNLDSFAMSRSTVVLGRAYSNYPMCSPSRISTLFGRLPSATGVMTNLDDSGNNIAIKMSNPSLPKYLQSQGYFTATGGKVFHEVGINGDNCWNLTYSPTISQSANWCLNDPLAKPLFYPGTSTHISPQLCVTNSPLLSLNDMQVGSKAAATLRYIKANNLTPFFLGVGFYKPHIPLQIHSTFWNMFPNGVPDVENDS